MIIANKELLDSFVQKHAQSAGPLNSWVEKVRTSEHVQSVRTAKFSQLNEAILA